MPTYVWLLLALVLAGVEMATMSLFLLPFAAGAAAAATLSALGAGLVLQLVSMLLVSLAALAATRPLANRLHRSGEHHRFGTDGIVAQRGFAVSDISEHGGLVRIGGEEWSARCGERIRIPAGEAVRVLAVNGATLEVYFDDEPLTELRADERGNDATEMRHASQ